MTCWSGDGSGSNGGGDNGGSGGGDRGTQVVLGRERERWQVCPGGEGDLKPEDLSEDPHALAPKLGRLSRRGKALAKDKTGLLDSALSAVDRKGRQRAQG